MADQTETAGGRDTFVEHAATSVIDFAARVVHEAMTKELGLTPHTPAVCDFAAAHALAARGLLVPVELFEERAGERARLIAENERLGARLDAARLNASDAERIANGLRADRDLLLWLHAELDHEVRGALHGLDSDLDDDAPLGDRVEELHESYIDATITGGQYIGEMDRFRIERNQLQARIDKALALTEPHPLRHSYTSRCFRAALQGDQPAAPPAPFTTPDQAFPEEGR